MFKGGTIELSDGKFIIVYNFILQHNVIHFFKKFISFLPFKN